MNEMRIQHNSDGTNSINLYMGMKLQVSIKFEKENILTEEEVGNLLESIRNIMMAPRKKEINDE